MIGTVSVVVLACWGFAKYRRRRLGINQKGPMGYGRAGLEHAP